jgi:hypothetical protein
MKFVQDAPQNKTLAYIVLWAVFISLIIILGMFGGCKSAEKKQAKMYGKFDKLKRKADSDSATKNVPARWSLDNFPMKISGTKTVYLPGTKTVTHDTITSVKTVKDTVYLTKTIRTHSHTVDTLHKVDTVLDSRPLAQLQTDYRALDAKLIQSKASEQIAKERLSKRTGVMWWLIAALVLLILWTLRKMFGILK